MHPCIRPPIRHQSWSITSSSHPGAAPVGTRSQATTPAEDKYIESECACIVRSNKLFGLILGHATDPAILQEIDTTTMIGNGRAAWAFLEGHGQPPRTGLANIDDDSKWSSLTSFRPTKHYRQNEQDCLPPKACEYALP
eukprot:6213015-Pleurochrysis_carterae.AAC.3